MSHTFDPYHKWLGIPPAEQPPHHYRLLGVALFEADADVIESAADQRMAHVRSFQTGKHSAESQRILNELAAARRCLLDARQRVTYDDGLRLRFDEAEPFHAVLPVAVEISQPAVAIATAEPPPFVAERPVRVLRKGRSLRSQKLPWVMCAAVAVSALAWIGPMILKAKSQHERAAQDAQRVPVVKAPTLDKERPPVKETQTPPVVEPPLPEKESPPITNTLPRTAKSQGRYVRVELPRVGILSLAEVEVYSDGRNIAPAGKASQTNVAYCGEAAMAIDGETSGVFPRHPGTHTEHDVSRPWWEVDLGATRPLDKIVVFNRTDCCGERLEGFTLTVLDEKRRTVAQRTGIPAPQSSVAFDLRIDADGKGQLDALSGKQTLVLESQNAQSLSQRGGRLPRDADGRQLNLGFETGDLSDWTADGNAFAGQPTKGDHSGQYWIGENDKATNAARGTLTSVPFRVTDPYASFLMAGERSGDTVVEVVRRDGNSTILRAMGLSSNNLQPVVVDLRKHIGQEIFIRLFDGSEHGRVSFDDFRFHEIKPEVSPSSIRLEAGKTVDVLKLIDIERDSRTGKWHWGEGGALAGEGWRLLRLPVTIPPEYDLAMTLEGNAQAGEVQVILPMQDSQAELVVDGWGKTISGLRLVDGKGGDANETSRPGMFLHSGRPNHLLCQVRAGSITVICNGATVIDWHGDSAQLSLPFGTLAGCDGLLLGDLVGYRLSQLAITPVGAPTGSVTADGTKAPPPRAKGGDVKEEKLAVKPVVTAREVAQLKHHTGAVARVVFHRALPLLVSTGMDGRVVRWDLDKDNTPTELHKFRWEVWTAKFSPDGELLAFADRWNGETEVIFKGLNDGLEVQPIKDAIAERRCAVVSLAFSPDGRLFATGQDDGTIRLWELPSFTEFTPVSFGSNVVSLAFGRAPENKKGKRADYVLAAGCWDGLVRTMNVTFTKGKTPAVSRSFAPSHVAFEGKDRVECVRFSPDGELLAVTRHGGHINLHDWRTGESIREMPFVGGDVTWIAFHPEPQQPWCITAHRNERMACIWNYKTKELLYQLNGQDGGVLCAEFSPDGRRVATAAEDHFIKLWELSNDGMPPAAAKKAIRRKGALPALKVGE